MQGNLQDGANSVKRYILNNFYDGPMQDALDLFTGVFVPDKEKPSPLRPRSDASTDKPSLASFLGQLALFVMLAFFMWGIIGPTLGLWTPSFRFRAFLFVLAFPLVAFKVCEKNGSKFVVHPRLRPLDELSPDWIKVKLA